MTGKVAKVILGGVVGKVPHLVGLPGIRTGIHPLLTVIIFLLRICGHLLDVVVVVLIDVRLLIVLVLLDELLHLLVPIILGLVIEILPDRVQRIDQLRLLLFLRPGFREESRKERRAGTAAA